MAANDSFASLDPTSWQPCFLASLFDLTATVCGIERNALQAQLSNDFASGTSQRRSEPSERSLLAVLSWVCAFTKIGFLAVAKFSLLAKIHLFLSSKLLKSEHNENQNGSC